MQRATGQSDHLACIPGTGPRQSSSRRSFAPRHWCGATPRRSRGMEPTVRNPRIESALASEAALISVMISTITPWIWFDLVSRKVKGTPAGVEPTFIPSDFPDTAITKCCRENRKCTAYLTCGDEQGCPRNGRHE